MNIIKHKKKTMIIILIIFIVFTFFFTFQNNNIVVSNYIYKNEVIPDVFNDFKIAHISDLHNKMFGKEQSRLLKELEELEPDIIVITGDLVDRRKYNLENALIFIKGAKIIAPVYYVSGNHEAWSNKYSDIKDNLETEGVYVLDNSLLEIRKEGEVIEILGLSDPDFLTDFYSEGTNTSELEKHLNELNKSSNFKILLSHRPELFDIYVSNNIDLIFSGHAHGGQVRLPFIGGIIAPDQGFFPVYTSGSYKQGLSTMYVSRGLGNSIVPIRLFNRPEILVVALTSTV